MTYEEYLKLDNEMIANCCAPMPFNESDFYSSTSRLLCDACMNSFVTKIKDQEDELDILRKMLSVSWNAGDLPLKKGTYLVRIVVIEMDDIGKSTSKYAILSYDPELYDSKDTFKGWRVNMPENEQIVGWSDFFYKGKVQLNI